MSKPSYEALVGTLRKTATLKSVADLVSWDQETYMVGGAAEARSDQMSLLAGMLHERQTSSELGDMIAACEEDGEVMGDELQSANVRESRRDFDLETKLPADLVAEAAKVGSQSQEAWKEARAKTSAAAVPAPGLGSPAPQWPAVMVGDIAEPVPQPVRAFQPTPLSAADTMRMDRERRRVEKETARQKKRTLPAWERPVMKWRL